MKIRKIFGHVSTMEVDPNKEYYTKHGQHLNNLEMVKVSKTAISFNFWQFYNRREISRSA
jgi:hypothetical protein